MAEEQSRARAIGCRISEAVAAIAANPLAQFGFLVFCGAWFALGLRVDVLAAGLSILAVTLTQMVLNRQEEREKDAHVRDVALHAKLDELLHASNQARDELAGIEDLEEAQIERLKQDGVARLPGRPRKVAGTRS